MNRSLRSMTTLQPKLFALGTPHPLVDARFTTTSASHRDPVVLSLRSTGVPGALGRKPARRCDPTKAAIQPPGGFPDEA